MPREHFTIEEAAQYLGVHKQTLYRWERNGLVTVARTNGGHRRYTKEDLDNLLMSRNNQSSKLKRITVGYCRVSTNGQKEDLKRQEEVVTRYCELHGYAFRIIRDIGSGINYNKKGLQELIELICTNRCERIVINYKDRLVRFGYEILEQICQLHDVQIEIINQTDEVSYESELVDDVLAIITVFSEKLYGRRSQRNKRIVEANKELFIYEQDSHEDSEDVQPFVSGGQSGVQGTF